MVKMAKKLKKEKVNIDIINFGEEVQYEMFNSFENLNQWLLPKTKNG